MGYNIDVSKIAQELEFEISDVLMLLDLFMESSEKSLSEMDTGLSLNDFEMVYKGAHAIKGSSGTILLNDICELSKTIEAFAKSGADSDLKINIDRLKLKIKNLRC